MPLTAKQQFYLESCCHRWNVKVGATGSGKSFVDYAATIPKRILALRGEGLAVMLGNTRGTLERNILEPMRAIWGNDLVGNIRSDNTVNLFGQKVYALGADNKKHIQRIQGATFEYVYGDEVTTWSEGVFQMLKSRLRCKHSTFDGTCNPDNPRHWFKLFLDSNADIFQQHYTIDDGCLPPDVVEALKQEYAGTVFYGRYILGEWVAAEGLVYDMFDVEKHVVTDIPETEGDYFVSCDFGIQNATVFLLWRKVRNRNVWVCLREWYYSGRESKVQKSTADLVTGLKSMCGDIMPRLVIVDPSAAALIVDLRRAGFHVQAAVNDVINGISDVGNMLQQQRLLFTAGCRHTLDEFGVYAWDPRAADAGIDRPIKDNDHCMDAVRYFVKTRRLAVIKKDYISRF